MMRVRGRRVSPLLLGLFVSLSFVAGIAISPVQAKGGGGGSPTTSPYTCSVAVTYSPTTFYVQTTVKAAPGYTLPGPTETDYLASWDNGVLYNTQSVKYSVSSGIVTITVTVPVSSSGAGVYTFQSTILNSKGSQLTSCSGTYSL